MNKADIVTIKDLKKVMQDFIDNGIKEKWSTRKMGDECWNVFKGHFVKLSGHVVSANNILVLFHLIDDRYLLIYRPSTSRTFSNYIILCCMTWPVSFDESKIALDWLPTSPEWEKQQYFLSLPAEDNDDLEEVMKNTYLSIYDKYIDKVCDIAYALNLRDRLFVGKFIDGRNLNSRKAKEEGYRILSAKIASKHLSTMAKALVMTKEEVKEMISICVPEDKAPIVLSVYGNLVTLNGNEYKVKNMIWGIPGGKYSNATILRSSCYCPEEIDARY